MTLWIQVMILLRGGCPIRTPMDQSLLAAPHGFSQRATSFIASWCQGIHRMPLSRSIPEQCPTKTLPRSHHAQEPSQPIKPRPQQNPTQQAAKLSTSSNALNTDEPTHGTILATA